MIRSSRALPVCLVALSCWIPACASSDAALPVPDSPQKVAAEQGRGLIRVGEFFSTSFGDLVVLRVQDEYRLVRHRANGPIEGYYEVIFAVSEKDVSWNTWRPVAPGSGLDLAFISPVHVAVRSRTSVTAAR